MYFRRKLQPSGDEHGTRCHHDIAQVRDPVRQPSPSQLRPQWRGVRTFKAEVEAGVLQVAAPAADRVVAETTVRVGGGASAAAARETTIDLTRVVDPHVRSRQRRTPLVGEAPDDHNLIRWGGELEPHGLAGSDWPLERPLQPTGEPRAGHVPLAERDVTEDDPAVGLAGAPRRAVLVAQRLRVVGEQEDLVDVVGTAAFEHRAREHLTGRRQLQHERFGRR